MGLTIDIFVNHLKFSEIVHTHVNTWLQKSECILEKRSAADGERELIDSSVWSRKQLAGNSSSASSSYHLWQKTVSMCTMVKTYWWLNALSASCECGRFMLSKVVTKPAFHSLPFISLMLQLGAWQYGILDHNDPSKPSHRLTNGPEPWKTIESDGSNIKKPS